MSTANHKLSLYPDAEKEIDPQFPRPRGRPIQTSCWLDSNLAHDQVTRRSVEGYMLYVGSTLIKSKSSRQGAIASSTYGSELRARRTATEEALGVIYLLRSLGINLDGPTILLGDNASSLISVMNPKSSLSQRHHGISFHLSRKSEAASATIRYHVNTKINISDGLTKALGSNNFQRIHKSGGPIFV